MPNDAHDGMFLWVYLMLKELKSCVSVVQVQEVLTKMPKGLEGLYASIEERLKDKLSTATFDLCHRVLTWVVTTVVSLTPLFAHDICHNE